MYVAVVYNGDKTVDVLGFWEERIDAIEVVEKIMHGDVLADAVVVPIQESGQFRAVYKENRD